MSLKYIKAIFISIIIFFIMIGVYIIYIKDARNQDSVMIKGKELKTTKEITIGITEFDTINPILTKSIEVQYITKLVYEPLINITIDFDIEPAIAEEWSKIDNLTYIIKLKENKKWQNGENVTVEDIKFTINKIKETDSIYKENVENIRKIEKVDNNTLKIYLQKEEDFFEYMLCFPIMQQKTYNEVIPVGTGIYKIKKMEKEIIQIEGNGINLTIKVYNSVAELYNALIRKNVDLIITRQYKL